MITDDQFKWRPPAALFAAFAIIFVAVFGSAIVAAAGQSRATCGRAAESGPDSR